MSNQVRILALPIYRRYWLYHAWHDPQAAVVAKAGTDWRKGVNLEEKMQLLSEKVQLWVSFWGPGSLTVSFDRLVSTL